MTAATMPANEKAGAALQLRKETNLWKDAWKRLLRNKLAVFGLILVLFFLFLAIFADVLAPYAYDKQYLQDANKGPSA